VKQPDVPYYIYAGVTVGDDTTIFPYAVIGRQPMATGNIVRVPGSGFPPTRIGAGCIIGAHAVIYAGTWIGDNVLIGDGAVIREGCYIGNSTLIGPLAFLQYNVTVGERVRVGPQSHITGDMLIEDEVFMGPSVSSANDKHIDGNRPGGGWTGPILRRGCAIGAGAILLPGVEIGEGTLVGAGAVVTKDMPPGKLVVGIPARTLRDR